MNRTETGTEKEVKQMHYEGASERMKKKLDEWGEKYEEFTNGRRKRMSNFNRIVLMGRLTRDPQLKRIASGRSVADLGLAVSEVHKNKEGEYIEKTCFVDVAAWGRQAETCDEYLKKGSPVLVEGKLQLDQWVTQDGQKRSKHRVQADRVQFLNGPKKRPDYSNDPASIENAGENEDLPF